MPHELLYRTTMKGASLDLGLRTTPWRMDSAVDVYFVYWFFFCVRIYLGFPLRFIYSVIAQFLNTGSFLKILNIFNCFLIRFLLMQPNHYKDRRNLIFSSLFWIGCLFIFISYARYLSLSAFFCYFMHQWDLAIVFFIPRTNKWNDYKIGDK